MQVFAIKWRKNLKQEDIPMPYMRITDTLDMVGVQLCDCGLLQGEKMVMH